jgi:hypothetical protein
MLPSWQWGSPGRPERVGLAVSFRNVLIPTVGLKIRHRVERDPTHAPSGPIPAISTPLLYFLRPTAPFPTQLLFPDYNFPVSGVNKQGVYQPGIRNVGYGGHAVARAECFCIDICNHKYSAKETVYWDPENAAFRLRNNGRWDQSNAAAPVTSSNECDYKDLWETFSFV